MTERNLTIGVVQCALSDDMAENIAKVEMLISKAAGQGAQVIVTPELFQGHYFCKTQDAANFARAYPAAEHPCVLALQKLAAELKVVLPVSIFERDGPCYYNSVVMVDADGKALGTYRKTHIPDGYGYMEKYYFRPGNLGFKVWPTRYGVIGVGICWDQWFPEVARGMMLKGAEILLYPTAIGSEPNKPELESCERWHRAQQGHAVSNVVPIASANRVGEESNQLFYGSSFICDEAGNLVGLLDQAEEGVLVHTFDLDRLRIERAFWGFFNDLRPDLYRFD
ncbi:MAG: N-carbamoylputrescine amidase [Alphaproteobacteria bacterium]|nr:N-carbamoylputrescine amidase [Alphaproteobacteria bacterium]